MWNSEFETPYCVALRTQCTSLLRCCFCGAGLQWPCSLLVWRARGRRQLVRIVGNSKGLLPQFFNKLPMVLSVVGRALQIDIISPDNNRFLPVCLANKFDSSLSSCRPRRCGGGMPNGATRREKRVKWRFCNAYNQNRVWCAGPLTSATLIDPWLWDSSPRNPWNPRTRNAFQKPGVLSLT